MMQQGLKAFIGKGHERLSGVEFDVLVFLCDELEAIEEVLESFAELAEEVVIVMFPLERCDDMADSEG